MIDLSHHIIVLDLDDTLYLERDFAHSGFNAVGRWMETQYGVIDFGVTCTDLFDHGARGNVFDLALNTLGTQSQLVTVSELVEVYRTHKPEIVLADDAVEFLRRLRGLPCALITDGPATCQGNKIAALELEGRIGLLILTGTLPEGCGKPHPMAFERVEQWSGRPAADHVYIADNPAKDFITPRRRGWLTVQIQRPERIHLGDAPTAAHAAVHAIESLSEIILR